jgi:hypothetical protein
MTATGNQSTPQLDGTRHVVPLRSSRVNPHECVLQRLSGVTGLGESRGVFDLAVRRQHSLGLFGRGGKSR